jgi:hypothetical protein
LFEKYCCSSVCWDDSIHAIHKFVFLNTPPFLFCQKILETVISQLKDKKLPSPIYFSILIDGWILHLYLELLLGGSNYIMTFYLF